MEEEEAKPPAPQAPYEDVRRKLVERGYLEGRLERFVLRDLAGSARSFALARAGLRAALLGGPILGGLLTAAAAAANRPVLRASDDLVLWLYFSVLAGAAVYLLQLAAGIVVAGLARRRGAPRRDDTLRASLLVALPTLGYLLLLWWRRGPGAGLGLDALFLGAALSSTLLVAWLAGLVSLAGIIGRTGQVPDRSRGRVRILVLVLLPLAAATLLARSALERAPQSALLPPPFDIAPQAQALLFVGVDGLDSALLESLKGEEMRWLRASRERGAQFPLARRPGLEPAEVWTTLMTGMPPEAHGVRSAGGERLPGVGAPLSSGGGPALLEGALRFLLPGSTVPTSGSSRRVRTLWEIAELKAPAAAVGFWASWPAREPGQDPGGGYVVSDRVLAKLLAHAAEDRDTAPESLYQTLAARFEAERAALREEFELGAGTLAAELRTLTWESFLIDAYHARTILLLRKDDRVRASFVYLPGLDILRTRLAGSMQGKSAPQLLLASRALETYVVWLDRLLEGLVAPGTSTLLVADPGRSARGAEQGLVLVLSPHARAGCVGEALQDVDVAPLALTLAGFPRSAEMPGRAPLTCLDSPQPPPEIASYGRKAASRAAQTSDYDRDMLERLRSLGYVH